MACPLEVNMVKAISVRLFAEMLSDYSAGLLKLPDESIEERLEREEAERTAAWDAWETEREGYELLRKLRADMEQCYRNGDEEGWYEVYNFYSDVSKDVYGFRDRIRSPFRKDEEA